MTEIIMTKRRLQILNFIKDYQDKNGYSPTITEIAKGIPNNKSLSLVQYNLDLLEKQGYIRRAERECRPIVILKDFDKIPKEEYTTHNLERTKQVLSVADLSEIYFIVQREIQYQKSWLDSVEDDFKFNYHTEKYTKKELAEAIKEEKQRRKNFLDNNQKYQAMLRLYKAFETLNIEIETPKLEIKGEE